MRNSLARGFGLLLWRKSNPRARRDKLEIDVWGCSWKINSSAVPQPCLPHTRQVPSGLHNFTTSPSCVPSKISSLARLLAGRASCLSEVLSSRESDKQRAKAQRDLENLRPENDGREGGQREERIEPQTQSDARTRERVAGGVRESESTESHVPVHRLARVPSTPAKRIFG